LNDSATTSSEQQTRLEITPSRQFSSWLAEQGVSLGLTTYQAGKLFLLGIQPDGRLSIFERTFGRCMGLAVDQSAQTLWMSSLFQIWRFENALAPAQMSKGYDRLYVPQVGYTTGDLDVHDLAIDVDGLPVFVNTLFSCLATTSETHSFKPLWKPPFISRLAAEDRCHLNGLAMEAGRPRYATSASESDVADGWRDRRSIGGCLIDVQANEVVLRGLSMPHSPRLYNGKIWLLNSGTGELGTVDVMAGQFEPVAFCPGYARGMTFIGDFAVIGLSLARGNKTFSGLPLDALLHRRGAEPRCGLMVVDLRTGDTVHWVRIEGVVSELYDVVALPSVNRPMALGFKSDEIRRILTIEDGMND
jgi:uncharacterized protein (TIGR03032 family)